MKLITLLAATLLLPLLVAGGLALRDDGLNDTEASSEPLITSPTPRTVTDERQLRIVGHRSPKAAPA